MRQRPARTLAAGTLAALALAGSLSGALAQDAAVGGVEGINCGHFVTIDHAQLFFESVFQRAGDRYGLDVNADGTACEGGEINTLFDLSCALFIEQADAQALYDLDRATYRALDADGDGFACSPQTSGGGGGGNRGGTDAGTVIAPTDPGAGATTTTTTTTIPGFELPPTEIVLPQNFPFGTGPSEIGIEISPDQLDALDADCLSFAVVGTMVMGHNCAGGDFIGTLPPGTPPDLRISHTPFFQAGAIFTPVGGGGGGRNGGAGQSPAIDPNTGQPIQQQAQSADGTDTATADSGRTRTRKQKAAAESEAQPADAAQPAGRERRDRAQRARDRHAEARQAALQGEAAPRDDAAREARAERKARKAERRAARAEALASESVAAEQPVSAEAIQRSVDRAVERALRGK